MAKKRHLIEALPTSDEERCELAARVVEWLKDNGHRNLQPVAVTFIYQGRKRTYTGVRYSNVQRYTEFMDCVRRGDKRVGEEYERQTYYLVGDLPESAKLKKRPHGMSEQKIVYRIGADEGDWYVAGYYELATPGDTGIKGYHPFGPWFSLGRWPHEEFGQRIDHYDQVKRHRLSLDEELLTLPPPKRYHNFYECECGERWQDDDCDSMHNDHCPSCDAEIEPYDSKELT